MARQCGRMYVRTYTSRPELFLPLPYMRTVPPTASRRYYRVRRPSIGQESTVFVVGPMASLCGLVWVCMPAPQSRSQSTHQRGAAPGGPRESPERLRIMLDDDEQAASPPAPTETGAGHGRGCASSSCHWNAGMASVSRCVTGTAAMEPCQGHRGARRGAARHLAPWPAHTVEGHTSPVVA